MSNKIRSIPRERYQKVRGKAFFRSVADKAAGVGKRNLGDCVAEMEMSIDTSDIKSNAESTTPKVAVWVNDANASVKLTLRQTTLLTMALGMMSDASGRDYAHAAVAAGSFTIEGGAKDGEIFEITDDAGKRIYNATILTATNDCVALGLKKAGRFEVVGDQNADIVLTYSAPISDKKFLDFLSTTAIDGELVIEQEASEGPSYEFVFPLGTLSKPGNRSLINGENTEVTQDVTFDVLFDDTQPAGQERGYVVEL